MQVIKTMTEWALPCLECPCCGTATTACPPPGAHAGSVSYGPALNAAVILSFRVSQGCDLRRPVVDSVADGTLAA